MKEMDSLEQAMSQWKPRVPSGRVARRLFGEARGARRAWRGAEFWSWLTPVVACAFTILLAVGSTVRTDSFGTRSGPMIYAGLIDNANSSNTPELVELTALDENVEWNAYPAMMPLAKAAGTNLNRTY